jgi:hypothetical protein
MNFEYAGSEILVRNGKYKKRYLSLMKKNMIGGRFRIYFEWGLDMVWGMVLEIIETGQSIYPIL